MHPEAALFFSRKPETLPLYEAVEAALRAIAPEIEIRVQKTQVTFRQKRVVACVWLPLRRVKARPETYILVTFGLPYRVDSPRILGAVEPAPNRWTHHVPVASAEEVDEELKAWLREAYGFAMR